MIRLNDLSLFKRSPFQLIFKEIIFKTKCLLIEVLGSFMCWVGTTMEHSTTSVASDDYRILIVLSYLFCFCPNQLANVSKYYDMKILQYFI